MRSDGFERLKAGIAGRYALLEEIGRGGMAVVYKATDTRHGRVVAVKVLEPEMGVTIGAERFRREIAIEASLEHPNILSLIDSGRIDEFLYFVTPFADGGSLRDHLQREGPVGIEDALKIIRDVGGALSHAHDKGIVHRDIKPANILFSAGRALIADFGIAQAVSDVDDERLTESGVSIGTPTYMSPEQASGDGRIDQRSDTYSLGCVLFEMLVGEPPFTGPNARVVFARQISERPPSVQIARPDVSDYVAAALQKVLSKDPSDRQATVEAFLDDLGRTDGPLPGHGRRSQVGSWAAAAGVGAVALAAWWGSPAPPAPELSRDKVAVFPLATRGLGAGDQLDGTGVSYLLQAALEHADPLRLVDATAYLTPEQRGDPASISAGDAAGVAVQHGAAFYLTGIVQGYADSTTVILQLHDVVGDSLLDQQSANGDAMTPLHHLGIDALLGLLPALIEPGNEIDLAALRDRRVPAIVLWWQGEREYRLSKFRSALGLYERALAEDSALAIAAVKGGQAAHWSHDNARGQAMVGMALARADLLPDRYVVLARGMDAFFAGRSDSAVHWLSEARDRYPDWPEAAAALGEVYYHLLPESGPLDSLAEAAFARVSISDGFTPPLYHLAELNIRSGALASADAYVEALQTAGAESDLVGQLSLMRECVADPTAMDWRAQTMRSSLAVFSSGKSLSAGALQHECAEGAFRALLSSPVASPGERWGAFLGLQGLLVASGRDDQATALIDSVSARQGIARSLYVLGALAGATTMREPARELDAFARQQFGETYAGVVNAESLWVLSNWLRHEGERARLDEANARLLERAEQAAPSSLERMLASAVSASEIARVDSAVAIEELRRLPTPAPESLAWGFGASLAPERLLLARLLLARGRHREAIWAASVFDHPEPVVFVQFVPESLRVRYEAALALNDRPAAQRYRARLEALYRLDLIADRD